MVRESSWTVFSGCVYRFIQFFLRLGCGKASPDPRSQPVLLQFSVNGGLSWKLLHKFFYTNSSNQAELVALEIPLEAHTTETRLRWWQPSENGYFHSPWVIDKVKYLQPSSKHLCIKFYIYLFIWSYIKCLIFLNLNIMSHVKKKKINK